MQTDIVGIAYKQQYVDANAQENINWFPIKDDSSRSKIILYPTPGSSVAATVASNSTFPTYLLGSDETNLYAWSNNVLYKLAPTGDYKSFTVTSLGTTAFTDLPRVDVKNVTLCSTTDSSSQLFFGNTQLAYVYNWNTNTLVQVTSPNFVGCSTCTYMDGYIFYSKAGTNQVYSSSIDDATTWSALNTTTFNAKSDTVVAVIANQRDLYVIGTRSGEIWYDAGDAQFPFERRDSVQIERGTTSPRTVKNIDTTVGWLDSDGAVVIISQYYPQIVSTDAITAEIRTYPKITDAYANSYQELGHWFYEITFPSVEVTWVYDMTEQQWHKRSYWDAANSRFIRNRMSSVAFLNNKLFAGDPFSGKVFYIGYELATWSGDTIRRIRVTTTTNDQFKNLSYHSLELVVGKGNALATADGTDPMITLKISHDNGHTFPLSRDRSIGQMGNYRKRVRWYQLGTYLNWTFKIETIEPVVLLDASVMVTGIPSLYDKTVSKIE